LSTGSFKEGDTKGFAEIQTGDLQIQKLVLYPREASEETEKFYYLNIILKNSLTSFCNLTKFSLLLGI
jgi:hypothetical protein